MICFMKTNFLYIIFYISIAIKLEAINNLIIVAYCPHNLLKYTFLDKQGKRYCELCPTETQPTKNLLPLAKTGGFCILIDIM